MKGVREAAGDTLARPSNQNERLRTDVQYAGFCFALLMWISTSCQAVSHLFNFLLPTAPTGLGHSRVSSEPKCLEHRPFAFPEDRRRT